MQRYFLESKKDNNLNFYEKDLHHIKHVMRFKVNDQIEAIWNQQVYLCNIDNLEPFSVSIVKIIDQEPMNKFNLTIAVSLVQEQKFDLILQKLTELGVSEIIPVKTERSIVKIDDTKLTKKYQRWNTICKEASEQCHRIDIPKIDKVLSLKELTQITTQEKFICSLTDTSKPLNEYLTKELKEALFIIGPEGGFSKQEENYLLENNFHPITLGTQVLRVETATIYVASIINYIYGGR